MVPVRGLPRSRLSSTMSLLQFFPCFLSQEVEHVAPIEPGLTGREAYHWNVLRLCPFGNGLRAPWNESSQVGASWKGLFWPANSGIGQRGGYLFSDRPTQSIRRGDDELRRSGALICGLLVHRFESKTL